MFKKVFFSIILALFFVVVPVHAEEKINNFVSVIRINSDATFHVQEKISYDFGEAERHGIYRDIPYKYDINGKKYSIDIKNINVSDENGQSVTFVVSDSKGQKDIKIGDADILLTGQKTYVIDYDVAYAINYFEDHDELYWNVTGNDWNVAMENVQTTIQLPKPSTKVDSQITCYGGPAGSTDKCTSFSFNFVPDSDEEIVGAVFNSKALSPNYGMTVVLGFSKDIVPSVSRPQASALETIIIFFGLPILTLISMIFLWYFKGRDKNFHDPIIAQYDSPDNLPPGVAGTIFDERVDTQDVSAEIIYLAIGGYLKINRIEKKTFVFKNVDYQLDKLKEADDKLKEYQKILLKAFFKDSKSVKLSDLKYKLAKDLKDVHKEMYSFVVDNNYFTKNPYRVRLTYTFVGIGLVFLASYIFSFTPLAVTNLLLPGIIIIIFSAFMSKRTIKGVKARNYILGLKEYIRVAEKERIKFHNAPEKNSETFEKFLPYAMIFKLEKEWAKQFEGIYLEQPNWYSGSNFAAFSAGSFVKDLNSFESAARSSFAQNSGSSSGMGGFSGGGFGGGGGGSW